MMPLAGKPMMQNIIERVQRAEAIDKIVVTCPVGDVLPLADSIPRGVLVDPWTGDESDLVSRYLCAALAVQADIIVRIPCDNPCVDPAYIDAAVTSYMNGDYTFYTNTTEYVNGLFVDGVGCEVFSASRLKWLDVRTGDNPLWREHPHKWFYDMNTLDDIAADIRLDVNTQEDYEFIKDIYDHVTHNRFTIAEVLTYLESKKDTA